MGKICTLDLAQHLISDRLWAPLPYTQHIYIERELHQVHISYFI